MKFAQFMSNTFGRIIRIIAGLAIVLLGLFAIQGTMGIIIAIIGLAPLLAGIFNVCIFAPLFGGPFKGNDAQK